MREIMARGTAFFTGVSAERILRIIWKLLARTQVQTTASYVHFAWNSIKDSMARFGDNVLDVAS